LSGLTKKTVYADRVLSTLLGVAEGDFVSYAQISKGLHQYIKDKGLKNATGIPELVSSRAVQPSEPAFSKMKHCTDCGAEIPGEAVFCDLCGVSQ
jgi:hypothetical protein